MNILTVDIGAYSLKFIEGRVDRKNLAWVNAQEIVIDDVKSNFSDLDGIALQAKIVELYLEEASFEGKLVVQLPSSYTTNRFLSLPVPSKKKAELMVPFQLEEDLPFQGSQTHFAAQYLKTTNGYYALISACLLGDFDSFFKAFDRVNSALHTITSELSLMQSWSRDFSGEGSYLIVDMGHETTKMYAFHDNAISSTHLSYVAGKKIEENISTHYDISAEEARTFKHQNAFFLTKDQFEKVDEDQSEFGKLMDKTAAPLVSEIGRLVLGHRIKHGVKVQKIYVTGGSSKIKNTESYLQEKLKLPVEKFSFVPARIVSQNNIDPNVAYRMGTSYLLAKAVTEKKSLMNFRSGEYTSNAYEDLPLHSTAFIGVRVAMVSMILLLLLITERLLINSDMKKLNANVTKILKTPMLNVSRKERRFLRQNPEKIERKLRTKKAKISSEVKLLTGSLGKNASLGIDTFGSKMRRDLNVYLEKYTHDDGEVYALFNGLKKDKVKALEQSLERLNLKDLKIEVNEKLEQVVIKYKDSNNG